MKVRRKTSLRLGLAMTGLFLLSACTSTAPASEASIPSTPQNTDSEAVSPDSGMEDEAAALPQASDDEEMEKQAESTSVLEQSEVTVSIPEIETADATGPATPVEVPTKDVVQKDQETTQEPPRDLPSWFEAELTDVNSDSLLSVADLGDKVILVETMAIWCSNCLRQQKEVKALHETLGERDDLVTLVLDIDPNESDDNLRAYAAKHGFDWTYVVAPREVAREIGLLYGDQFLNPPSTPMLIIDRSGEVHLLPFGRKSAEDLRQALDPFLQAGS
ncbi:TlpA family protein disulfide reductase [Chloroflexota bacterium]